MQLLMTQVERLNRIIMPVIGLLPLVALLSYFFCFWYRSVAFNHISSFSKGRPHSSTERAVIQEAIASTSARSSSSGLAPPESGKKKTCLKVVVGIFSVRSKESEKRRRARWRTIGIRFLKAGDSLECGLNFVFVVGSNDVKDKLGNAAHILPKWDGDVITLPFRENMNEGKSRLWMTAANRLFQDFDYIAKMDSDTMICPAWLLAQFEDADGAGYFGSLAHRTRFGETDLSKNFTEYRYFSGGLYALSRELVQKIFPINIYDMSIGDHHFSGDVHVENFMHEDKIMGQLVWHIDPLNQLGRYDAGFHTRRRGPLGEADQKDVADFTNTFRKQLYTSLRSPHSNNIEAYQSSKEGKHKVSTIPLGAQFNRDSLASHEFLPNCTTSTAHASAKNDKTADDNAQIQIEDIEGGGSILVGVLPPSTPVHTKEWIEGSWVPFSPLPFSDRVQRIAKGLQTALMQNRKAKWFFRVGDHTQQVCWPDLRRWFDDPTLISTCAVHGVFVGSPGVPDRPTHTHGYVMSRDIAEYFAQVVLTPSKDQQSHLNSTVKDLAAKSDAEILGMLIMNVTGSPCGQGVHRVNGWHVSLGNMTRTRATDPVPFISHTDHRRGQNRAIYYMTYEEQPACPTTADIVPRASDRRKLLIAAHADDEVVWAGDLMMKDPEKWEILVVVDPDNESKFRLRMYFWNLVRYMRMLVTMTAFTDTLPSSPLLGDGGEAMLREKMLSKKWDLIVTHGEKGEYGHFHHKQLHKIVKKIFTNYTSSTNNHIPDQLSSTQLWFFDPILKSRKSKAWAYIDPGKLSLLNATYDDETYLPSGHGRKWVHAWNDRYNESFVKLGGSRSYKTIDL